MAEYKITLNGTEYYLQVEKIKGDDDRPVRAPVSAKPALAPPPRPVAPQRTPASAPAPAKPSAFEKPATAVASGSGGREEITAPIPGRVVDILVKEGQDVKKGEVLLILDAMKMENEVVASGDGMVGQILTSKDAFVNAGDVLMVLL